MSSTLPRSYWKRGSSVDHKPSAAVIVPGGIGSVENVPSLLDLIERLSRSFNLSVYSFSDLAPHPVLAQNNCKVSFVSTMTGGNSVLKILSCVWRIRKDAQTTRFPVVHGFWAMPQGLAAVLAGKLLGVPSIVSVLGGDIVRLPEIGYGGLRSFFHKSIVRWTVKSADRVTLLTRFQKGVMEANGISSSRAAVILFGADLSRFQFRPHAISTPVRLGFIGNINRVKDPFTLINAFSILQKKLDCSLTIVGSDILKGQAQEYARSLGVFDAIRWEGKSSHDSIPEILSTCDFLLLTSLYEGEAVVVMEAFAVGVVVVGTRVGLLADIGDERTTVIPGDAESLAAKIRYLIGQPDIVREIQEKNRKFAEEHTSEMTGSKFKRLYEEVMNGIETKG